MYDDDFCLIIWAINIIVFIPHDEHFHVWDEVLRFSTEIFFPI